MVACNGSGRNLQDLYGKRRINRKFANIEVGNIVCVKSPNIFDKKIQRPYKIFLYKKSIS